MSRHDDSTSTISQLPITASVKILGRLVLPVPLMPCKIAIGFVVDYARESRLHLSYSFETMATFVAADSVGAENKLWRLAASSAPNCLTFPSNSLNAGQASKVRTSIFLNFLCVMAMALFGIYYSIAQKINEENLLSLLASYNITVNTGEYISKVTSQTAYAFRS